MLGTRAVTSEDAMGLSSEIPLHLDSPKQYSFPSKFFLTVGQNQHLPSHFLTAYCIHQFLFFLQPNPAYLLPISSSFYSLVLLYFSGTVTKLRPHFGDNLTVHLCFQKQG